MPEKFQFLCGLDHKRKFVYAIKSVLSPFYYFDELDSIIDAHTTLPADLRYVINSKQQTIELTLTDQQTENYCKHGKFVFKNKELKTYLTLANESQENEKNKQTKDLKFTPGKTNPLLFLAEFEKCRDIKDDHEKTCKIRQFVKEDNKDEFNQFCYTDNWLTVKSAFIKTFSLQFIQNQKRDMDIDFKKEPNLRTFVDRKLSVFQTYTTLPFQNQIEMILNDLPSNIAKLFMVNEKLECNKTEILDFCDTIQDSIQTMLQDQSSERNLSGQTCPTSEVKQLEVVSIVDEQMDVSTNEAAENDTKSNCAGRGGSRGAGRGGRSRGTGRAGRARRTGRVLKGKVVPVK